MATPTATTQPAAAPAAAAATQTQAQIDAQAQLAAGNNSLYIGELAQDVTEVSSSLHMFLINLVHVV